MTTASDVQGFGSDNHAPAHPEILDALFKANAGDAHAYGMDPWSERLVELVHDSFGTGARAYPVFNGTAANVLGIGACLKRHEAVIAHRQSHLNVDECGAPEAVLGAKVLPVEGEQGRIAWKDVQALLIRRGDQHVVQPKVLSITQSTEVGTVYPPEALGGLCRMAHAEGLLVHVDGARLANAAAALGLTLAEASTHLGVDVLSFGGAKNGLLLGELVVFLREGLDQDFRYLRKRSMQLASKSRFIAAQFVRYLEDERWRAWASHANAMARMLSEKILRLRIPGVELTHPTEANAVFVRFPRGWVKELKAHAFFYVWDEATFECRLMCSWDTREETIEDFVHQLERLAQHPD